VKLLIFRVIEPTIKALDMNSPHLLDMIETCPEGAEPLIARIVHLLTEKSLPPKELVEKVRNLHNQRQTDVRSLLPIMVGLDHKELLKLIPKFVLSAANAKSVPVFFRKLLFSQHIETRKYLMSHRELLVRLHRCKPANDQEMTLLSQNIDQVGFTYNY
jgi:symplekin